MNINAKHFQGWVYQPGTDHITPMVIMPSSVSFREHDAFPINHPNPAPPGVRDEIARLLAHAPELFRLTERFFSFYELHKAARGGQLGREYEELRAKIVGEVKP